MNRLFISFFLLIILIVAFSQDMQTNKRLYLEEYIKADNIYRKAEQLSSQPDYTDKTVEKEDAMNRKALVDFKNILPAIEKAQDDSLAFHCYNKIGVLEHYFDSLTSAKRYYEMAITVKSRLPSLSDSFLFKPYLFIGGIQYNRNQFDSALINYKKAEEIAAKYTTILDGTNRLYNTLGAMYYETGNYRQAKNYFDKAIALLGTPDHSNESLLINYQINLAATLTKLEEFAPANNIYLKLLKQETNKNDILHSIGTINLRIGDGRKALTFLKQVNYSNHRVVKLMNDIGQAYENINQSDSAYNYYQKAVIENKKWSNGQKNVQAGLTLKYLGDLNYRKSEFKEALQKYQLAIIQLVTDFNSTDVYNNPEQYSGVFSYINLFNLLTAKADALEKLYQKGKNIADLEASLDAYRFAFRLTDYVEKTYNSDEARLFLGKIIYAVHSKPIDISLQLFNLTKKRNYLEEAYFFDQRNKASVLSFNVRENELNNLRNTNNDLLSRQSSLKSSITRLSLNAAQITDSLQLLQINASIRDGEIELGKLEEKLNNDPLWQQKITTGQIPSVNQLQRKLDNTTALLSFHLSENELLTLLITSNQFEYRSTVINRSFFSEIESFKEALQNTSSDETYNGITSSMSLYQTLISPVLSKLTKIKKLIIIPDDELNYLPFEALQDENRRYMVEKFSVQYQYTTALLGKDGGNLQSSNTLAFAPFASYNYSDTTGNLLSRLPASADEVNTLQGKIFIDSVATKNNFLQSANHYSIIHLATHATVNNNNPFQSYIAFNPVNSDYKLYAQEIYNLNLDSTQLIILSACETGAGKLVKGEGLMSLSRAFAYAGCPNIITSLWKAEDKTTSFITQRLHYYLSENFSKDKALQLAKLDLLHSNDIDPRFKTPGYWAHLIFIGSYEPDHKRNNWKWVAIGIIVTLMGYQFAKKKGLTLKRQASSS